WPVAHQAFARQADPVLGQPPSLVAHLGIDEHRRGRPRWRIDAETSEYVLLADRWHTCFFGLSGDQGLLGQAAGRDGDAAYWLAPAPPAWRDHIQVVATGMCSIYASAVRRMLPGGQLVVDLFYAEVRVMPMWPAPGLARRCPRLRGRHNQRLCRKARSASPAGLERPGAVP